MIGLLFHAHVTLIVAPRHRKFNQIWSILGAFNQAFCQESSMKSSVRYAKFHIDLWVVWQIKFGRT